MDKEIHELSDFVGMLGFATDLALRAVRWYSTSYQGTTAVERTSERSENC